MRHCADSLKIVFFVVVLWVFVVLLLFAFLHTCQMSLGGFVLFYFAVFLCVTELFYISLWLFKSISGWDVSL